MPPRRAYGAAKEKPGGQAAFGARARCQSRGSPRDTAGMGWMVLGPRCRRRLRRCQVRAGETSRAPGATRTHGQREQCCWLPPGPWAQDGTGVVSRAAQQRVAAAVQATRSAPVNAARGLRG